MKWGVGRRQCQGRQRSPLQQPSLLVLAVSAQDYTYAEPTIIYQTCAWGWGFVLVCGHTVCVWLAEEPSPLSPCSHKHPPHPMQPSWARWRVLPSTMAWVRVFGGGEWLRHGAAGLTAVP